MKKYKKLLQNSFFCIESSKYYFNIVDIMEKFTLNAEVRSETEKAKELKANKQLAWVVYGKKTEPISIKMDYSEFLKLFRKTWESHIINLLVGKKDIEVLVQTIQKQPVSWDYYHIDFYAITKGEKVQTNIPLNFVWESQAVREGNILDEHLKEIQVKCLPTDLVDNFEVNLSKLANEWDSIRVWELGINTDKYEVLNNPDDMIVAAHKPAKVEEIPTEAPESEIPSEEDEGSKEGETEEK